MENVLQSRSIKASSKGIFFTEDTAYHPLFLFNNSAIQQISTQKYMGINLDEELTFKCHINEKIDKANKNLNYS